MTCERTAFRPERALSHPLWLGALCLLVVNDHLLKGAGILPGWLTGKLSDLAGFLLLPMLLAVLVRARTRAVLLLCHAAAAGLLLGLELSPGLCALVHRTLGLRLWADPTDLVALLSIVVSYRVLGARAAQPRPIRRSLVRPAVFVGALACAASSPSDPPPRELSSAVVLHNQSGRDLDVRLSAPREGLRYDCTLALRDPQVLFRPEHFVAYEHVRLPPSDLLPLDRDLPSRRRSEPVPQDPSPCQVRLLSVEGSAERLVVWDPKLRPMRPVTSGASLPSDTMIVVDRDGQVSGPTELLRPAPSVLPPEPAASCAAADPSADPAWTSPGVQGTWRLRALERGTDGCHVATLGVSGFGERRITLCAEPLGVPFAVGDDLTFILGDLAPDGSGSLQIERSADRTALFLSRRTPAQLAADPGACRPTPARCGVVISHKAAVSTPAGTSPPLGTGQRIALSGGGWAVDLAVTRAEQLVLVDAECSDGESLIGVASYVWIRRKE